MFSYWRTDFSQHKRTIAALFFGFAFSVVIAYATPPGSPYNPGATLDPACAPGDTNCSVSLPTLPNQTGNNGKYLITDGATMSWSTLPEGASLIGSTSTSGTETWIGQGTGGNGASTTATVFIGLGAGAHADHADGLIAIGANTGAGINAVNASNSVFVGNNAGTNGTNASDSIFIGRQTGQDAPNAAHSIFIGQGAGLSDTVNNTVSGNSILIGDGTSTGGFSNSIAFGTNAANTASNQFLLGSTYTQFNIRGINYTMPSVLGSAGAVLTDVVGNGNLSWVVPSLGGGGGETSPAGANGEIQFNNSGVFGSSSSLIWNGSRLDITSSAAIQITSESPNALVVTDDGINGISLGTTIQNNGEYGLIENTNNTQIATYTSKDNNFLSSQAYIYADRAILVAPDEQSAFIGDPTGLGTQIVELQISGPGNSCTIRPDTAGINCTSDERLKTNIADLNDTLDTLLHVRTITYNWKNNPDSNQQIGFLAQDLRNYFPTLVSTDRQGYLQVNYAGMTPILTKAIQELDIKVDDLSDLTSDTGIFSRLRTWLADASNGIVKIFAGEIDADTIKTNNLCVGDVCVTPDQFLQMVHTLAPSDSQPETPPVVDMPPDTAIPPVEQVETDDSAPVVETQLEDTVPTDTSTVE